MNTNIPVRSTDPRKPAILAALKKASGCSRVTNIQEHFPNHPKLHKFSGDCLQYDYAAGNYRKAGRFEIGAADAHVPEAPHA